jgi:hypothetical protein
MKEWLTNNKIYFDTIAATLLSIMAVIISVVQLDIANKQTELAEIQTKIAQSQLEREERLAKFEKTANWGELRNAMWGILDQFPPSGIETIRSMPQEHQLSFFKKVRAILDSQIKNPVLIENEQCLGHWRNAISSTKTMVYMLSRTNTSEMQDSIIGNAGGILTDVMYVWEKLVLDSVEVSATGGRPKPDEQ